jgi:predicted RecB family nuclease
MPNMLTKSKIMAGLQCPRRLWLQVHRRDLAAVVDSPGIRQGNEVDRIAQRLFAGGVLIDGRTLQESVALTARAIAQSHSHIYQATAAAERVLIRADILSRTLEGWVLTEVKAATELKPEYLQDVAVQLWVLRNGGIPVIKAQLAHVDRDFTYPGDGRYEGLLKIVDVTADAEALGPQVTEWATRFRRVLEASEPVCETGAHCNAPVSCEFRDHCDPYKSSEHRPDVLPRIAVDKLANWRARGIFELVQVPDDEINDRQRVVKSAHLQRSRIVGEELGPLLSQLPYPRYYLDFETSNPALPRFAGMRPYAQITFQWSCHVQRTSGALEHREFLAPDSRDPRERFVRSLIEAVEADGPICVWYASFEKGRLAELARDLPAYSGAIDAIIDRIVDLHPMFVEHYYDPGMNGSWSLKAVLPTVDPALSYATLPGIRDGGGAMDAYLELVDPDSDPSRQADLREQLIRYCRHDTLAMFRMATKLEADWVAGRGP